MWLIPGGFLSHFASSRRFQPHGSGIILANGRPLWKPFPDLVRTLTSSAGARHEEFARKWNLAEKDMFFDCFLIVFNHSDFFQIQISTFRALEWLESSRHLPGWVAAPRHGGLPEAWSSAVAAHANNEQNKSKHQVHPLSVVTLYLVFGITLCYYCCCRCRHRYCHHYYCYVLLLIVVVMDHWCSFIVYAIIFVLNIIMIITSTIIATLWRLWRSLLLTLQYDTVCFPHS